MSANGFLPHPCHDVHVPTVIRNGGNNGSQIISHSSTDEKGEILSYRTTNLLLWSISPIPFDMQSELFPIYPQSSASSSKEQANPQLIPFYACSFSNEPRPQPALCNSPESIQAGELDTTVFNFEMSPTCLHTHGDRMGFVPKLTNQHSRQVKNSLKRGFLCN